MAAQVVIIYRQSKASGKLPTIFSNCADKEFFHCVENSYDSDFVVTVKDQTVQGALCCCNEDECNLNEGKCVGNNAYRDLLSLPMVILFLSVWINRL